MDTSVLKRRAKRSETTTNETIINHDKKMPNKEELDKYNKWHPSVKFVFYSLIITRFLSATYNQLWDCDEVYNYWEPLHFTLYNHGLQTWEYAPQYALRSYLYIYLHTLILLPLKYFGLQKITLFYTLRFVFAIIGCKCEAKFYESLLKAYSNSPRVAIYYFLLSLTNTGMFLSTTAFLPSTFVQYLIYLSYALWIQNNRSIMPIFLIALATLLGWPFVAIMGLPIVIDYLFIRRDILRFLIVSVLCGCFIIVTMCSFDSYLFGKFVLAPWNIIKYNVFPENKAAGPNLYGEEPLSFYISNCLLNFNIVYILSLVNLPLKLIIRSTSNRQQYLLTLTMYAWIIVFYTRPHKEERFLFPIYPLICLLAADTIELLSYALRKIRFKGLIPILILFTHFIFSLARIYALLTSYSSQLTVFNYLNIDSIKYAKNLESRQYVNVCMGKEWYRYTSSFFLPESYKRQKWRLKFIPSNFHGQLPGEYNEALQIPLSTRFFNKDFNDANLEVKKRYVDLKNCDFVIDTVDGSSKGSRVYDEKQWVTLKSFKMIDINKSTKFYRAIYIPKLYEKHTKFLEYKLLKRL